PPVGSTNIPLGLLAPVQLRITVFLTDRNELVAWFADISIPLVAQLLMKQSSTTSEPPVMNLTASNPVPSPSNVSPRSTTFEPAGAEITIPFVPVASTPAIQHPSIEMDFVIVTAPNPPGSSTSISPPVAVLEIAPANVLHGAVRLHGLASSPTPDTHVLVACACASENAASTTAIAARLQIITLLMFIEIFPPTLPQVNVFTYRYERKECVRPRLLKLTDAIPIQRPEEPP